MGKDKKLSEVERLAKENALLKRTIKELKDELKVDIKRERQNCYLEGYQVAQSQYQEAIEGLLGTIRWHGADDEDIDELRKKYKI